MTKNIFDDLIGASSSSLFSLQFKNGFASLEEEFTKEYLKRSAKYTRLSLIIGFIFYSFFGVLDSLIVPDQKQSLWLIRYAIVDPILILLIVFSFIKSLRKYTEIFGFIALIVAGSGISVMVAIAAPPANYSYYSGLILVLMLGYGFVRIRFTRASLAGWLNVFIYEGIAIFITDTPREILINNNFFL